MGHFQQRKWIRQRGQPVNQSFQLCQQKTESWHGEVQWTPTITTGRQFLRVLKGDCMWGQSAIFEFCMRQDQEVWLECHWANFQASKTVEAKWPWIWESKERYQWGHLCWPQQWMFVSWTKYCRTRDNDVDQWKTDEKKTRCDRSAKFAFLWLH